jgi:endonuclease YncB( thermonuclease family)
MKFIFFYLFLTFLFLKPVFSKQILGFANVIDGDTIHINSYKIRLEGIDAPEMKQRCKNSFLKTSSIVSFDYQEDYLCGEKFKNKLELKINKKKIRCILLGKDRYNRYLGTCFKNKINLNKWMVKNGYAIAYRRYSKKYILDEEFARKNKLGLWSGSFLNPEKWRKLN